MLTVSVATTADKQRGARGGAVTGDEGVLDEEERNCAGLLQIFFCRLLVFIAKIVYQLDCFISAQCIVCSLLLVCESVEEQADKERRARKWCPIIETERGRREREIIVIKTVKIS